MAPSYSRQLLVWSLPTLAVLFSYLWYKRKRIDVQSDPGDSNHQSQTPIVNETIEDNNTGFVASSPSSIKSESTPQSSPNRSFSRSLSGVDSQPIDIVIPRELKSVKSNPIVISDEDLDIEIEKIKSMRYGGSIDYSKGQPEKKKESSPKKTHNSPPPSTSPVAKAETMMLKKNNNNNNNIKVVEEKLSTISLASSNEATPTRSVPKNAKKKSSHDKIRHSGGGDEKADRDSANHSPADVMLASPSLSCISDNHSEGSNDSGKGGSEVVTPPPSRTPGTDGGSIAGDAPMTMPTIYEFIIPQNLVGKLIGKQGNFVTSIKDKTNAHIVVKKHPTNNKLKVCVIEGYQKEIDSALKLIRDKFPLKRFPDMTLEQVSFVTQIAPISLVPDHLYLKLVEGVNNDTIVSCMVAPNHLFLQQPTHPTFPNLNVLNSYMNMCYNEADSPLLPTPIPENTVCAAFSVDSWCRAIILSTDPETDVSYVKFLDYGGYAFVEHSQLRQIRGDFLLLPFQAAECLLANIQPIGENSSWPEEAYHFVADMTKGAIIYTQVVDYSEEGVPLVHCYVVVGPQQVVFLNQELVNVGFAEWMDVDGCGAVLPPSKTPSQEQQQPEGAAGAAVAAAIQV